MYVLYPSAPLTSTPAACSAARVLPSKRTARTNCFKTAKALTVACSAVTNISNSIINFNSRECANCARAGSLHGHLQQYHLPKAIIQPGQYKRHIACRVLTESAEMVVGSHAPEFEVRLLTTSRDMQPGTMIDPYSSNRNSKFGVAVLHYAIQHQ